MSRHHPVVKAVSYSLLGLFGAAVSIWSPAEALVICSVAFTADGLAISVLPSAWRTGGMPQAIVTFTIPLFGLLAGRGLVAYLGIG